MHQYQKLLAEVVQYGTPKGDRTGTGTLSLFGGEMRFDLAKGFPLVTTKKVFWKGVVEELLWMISGETNISMLQAKGVGIWDEWADENGDLGPVYGAQWRSWLCSDGDTIDQLAKVVQRIKVNPDCRRLIVTAWNPGELEEMALAPCHCLFQFNTRPIPLRDRWAYALERMGMDFAWGDEIEMHLDFAGVPSRYLDLRLDQRSADIFLGVPFNIASYSLLLLMVAQVTGTAPGHFIHQFGDVHLYANHIEQAKLQLSREIWAQPQVRLNPEVTDLFAFTAADISLLNYRSHDAIAAPVAV